MIATGRLTEGLDMAAAPANSPAAASRAFFVSTTSRKSSRGSSSNLRREFDVHTAIGPQEGLALIEATPEGFAVVISDMRMPQMNGAAFLAIVRQKWPDTVRMLLTGHSEIEAAITAVNEGQIFRFLNKPCPSDKLIEAVDAAVEQNRLIHAERVLLEQTLHGSIKALTDILSIQNPMAFGRAMRAKAHVSQLAAATGPARSVGARGGRHVVTDRHRDLAARDRRAAVRRQAAQPARAGHGQTRCPP